MNPETPKAYHEILNVRNKKDWETPEWLVRGIEDKWGIAFTLDAAASATNKKAPRWIGAEQNALSFETRWGSHETVWINPPYGESEIPAFVNRALAALDLGEARQVVMIIPNATENAVWQETIFPNAAEVCFIGGRVSFEESGKPISGNTKGSVLVFFERSNSTPKRKLSWVSREELRRRGTVNE